MTAPVFVDGDIGAMVEVLRDQAAADAQALVWIKAIQDSQRTPGQKGKLIAAVLEAWETASPPPDTRGQTIAAAWCGAPRELGGQQPCPVNKKPCPPDTCAIAGFVAAAVSPPMEMPLPAAAHVAKIEAALDALRAAALAARRDLLDVAAADAGELVDQVDALDDMVERLRWSSGVKTL